MVKAMKLREVEEALLAQDCKVLSERGPHTKWGCPCGAHTVPVPRHTIVSPGVVRSIGKRLACLPEGWLQ
jgi:predicted RNA binding protein YcfA (HicA-like mRNA interferase family)